MTDLMEIDILIIPDDAWTEATNGCSSTALKEHDDMIYDRAINV